MVRTISYHYKSSSTEDDSIAKADIKHNKINIYLNKLAEEAYNKYKKNRSETLEDIVSKELSAVVIHELIHTEGKIIHQLDFTLTLFNQYLDYGTLQNNKTYESLRKYIGDKDKIYKFMNEFEGIIKNNFYLLEYLNSFSSYLDGDPVVRRFNKYLRKEFSKYSIITYSNEEFEKLIKKII